MAFSDFTKKITDTAKGTVDKVKDSAEISRIEGVIKSELVKISQITADIGEKYAAKHTEDYDPEFSQHFEAIAAAKATIASCKAHLAELKGVLICPVCGEEIPREAAFCSKCGHKVERPVAPPPPEPEVPEVPEVRVCAKCGAPLRAGAAFCTECGEKTEA